MNSPINTDFQGNGLVEKQMQLELKKVVMSMSRGEYRKRVAAGLKGSGLSRDEKAEKARAERKRKRRARRK